MKAPLTVAELLAAEDPFAVILSFADTYDEDPESEPALPWYIRAMSVSEWAALAHPE